MGHINRKGFPVEVVALLSDQNCAIPTSARLLPIHNKDLKIGTASAGALVLGLTDKSTPNLNLAVFLVLGVATKDENQK